MKLTNIVVRNFRSYVTRGDDRDTVIDIGDGLNLFVGANNCGKSNLLRAVALALGDWEGTRFNRDKDCPIQIQSKRSAHAKITLTFKLNPRVSVEKTLLRYLEEYESAANPRQTHASNNEAHFCVEYTPNRRVVFLIRGKGNLTGNKELLDKCVRQFRKCLRFVYLKSGEGLGDFMKENLHEILEMVLKEHLSEKFQASEDDRLQFIQTLENGLLHEMGNRLKAELQKVVREIDLVGIEPKVPMLNEMLSAADIRLGDSAETILLDKGTGIRGVLLVAFLRYLCQHSKRSMVLAIEEPECFLHPEAQMSVRSSLEELGAPESISLLVTTHSPLMLSRRPEARISGLIKNENGETIIDRTIAGTDSHAPVISTIYGSLFIPCILESIHPFESTCGNILIVEGYTDKFYLEHAARVSQQEDLLEGFEIRFCEGAHAAASDALLIRQLMGHNAKVMVLFDYDDEGRAARTLLKKRYKWGNNRTSEGICEYRKFRNVDGNAPVEAEDMYPAHILEKFVKIHGDGVIAEKSQYNDGSFHYGLTQKAKKEFTRYVDENIKASQVSAWLEIIREMRSFFQLT